MSRITRKHLLAAADTKIERNVARWLWSYTDGEPDDIKTTLEDLLQHGCQSGMVGHLIYYSDTIRFYNRNIKDINSLVIEMQESTGESISELLRDWDSEDPLCQEDSNKNLLAWFGFEESARNLAGKLGLEL